MKNNKNISRFQYITFAGGKYSIPEQVESVCNAGGRWIQFRIKNEIPKKIENIALQIKKICLRYDTLLIINDKVELAIRIGVHGVHLGKGDMNPVNARKITGDDFIIGGTANTFENIQKLQDAGVDYIGLGPFRFTSTKKKLSPVLGITGISKIVEQCTKHNINIPVIAIGGITRDDIFTLLSAGIYGIAVSSAIAMSENIEVETCRYIESINKYSSFKNQIL
ncbi:MAG: thiamine phosphate synthase [Bacteroidia bacterium]|nr:thiamine phosphate synthase [Bacteroidia bacterium]